MTAYIDSIDTLAAQLIHAVLLSESEIQAAIHVLSRSPVIGYPPFTEGETRLIAAYREYLNPRLLSGRRDDIWEDIVSGEWYAWLYAVHEAAELQAFADMEVYLLDRSALRHGFEEAHIRAVLVEARYSWDWAKQIGIDTSEIAIEIENPMRQLNPDHNRFLNMIQSRQSWSQPNVIELKEARRFWQRLRNVQHEEEKYEE